MPSHMNDPHSVEIGMGIIHMRTMPILGKSGLLMLRSGQEVLLARQNGVENHSHHERHRDAVGSEDGLEQRREVGENVADRVKPMPMVRLNAAMVMLRCV